MNTLLTNLNLYNELKYPKSKLLELDFNDYIKGDDSTYLHSLGLSNTSESIFLIEKHTINLVFISIKNKKYEQKLYNDVPFFLEKEGGMIYDDNYVKEIDGTYKINDWEQGDEVLMDLFHPDMDFGKYIIFMKINFPEHKKTLYSDKYVLEYVPAKKITE